MANEAKTENIVRNELKAKGYYDNPNIIIEEKISDIPKINKLLQSASKSNGGGVGRPEFIISFKNNPDDIIVVECKASTLYHESKKRDNYKNYAVDGVLLYADYLKKEFNVTAIAVSGETDREKKISTFLWLKQHYIYKDVQDKIFLKSHEIEKIIQQQAKPFQEEELIKKAVEYNSILHVYSIPEVERCTLISAVLIALQNDAFLKSFQYHDSNNDLIESMLTACKNVLNKNQLDYKKIDIVLSEYSKFKYYKHFNDDTYFDKKKKQQINNTILRDFIIQIKDDILPHIKSSEFDVLGKFYTQFIRYAGSDKKTGLVLTPTHITDLFCDIAELSVCDIVFDPCCGTAGFLVAAMNYMLKKAGHDSQKQLQIKSNQLIGIEQRPDMFAHACSNMMMRGDGKSQIIYGDCFESIDRPIKDNQGNVPCDDEGEQIYETVKLIKDINEKFHPTKAFLNPPYQDGNAHEQLEFIENSLECLVKDGICVAICQMSTAVSDKKEVIAVRKRLLENHTLEAVFSMPNDLFHPVGVVTCILVFKAHNPHSEDKKTFFGYFKDDGFIKTKNKGRIDAHNKWQSIKQKWLSLYKNKESVAGLSIMTQVNATNEWCAEAYMETDYSALTENDFIKTIKDYVIFQFLHGDTICS
jgi:type I restriction enzyme M protein